MPGRRDDEVTAGGDRIGERKLPYAGAHVCGHETPVETDLPLPVPFHEKDGPPKRLCELELLHERHFRLEGGRRGLAKADPPGGVEGVAPGAPRRLAERACDGEHDEKRRRSPRPRPEETPEARPGRAIAHPEMVPGAAKRWVTIRRAPPR